MNRTAQIFESFTRNDEWLGYGYLGERENALVSVRTGEAGPMLADRLELADEAVLQATADWSDEELFAWANSKDGRWFADCVLGSAGSFQDALRQGRQYLRKQRSL